MIECSKSAERKKNQILSAAITNIELAGLSNVTLQSVAQTAGLSKGGVTHYYPSKRVLLLDVFNFYFVNLIKVCEDQVAAYEKPLDKLFSLDFLFHLNHPEFKVAHPVFHDFISVAVHDMLFRELYYGWVETWVKMISDILKDGMTHGSIDPCDADSLARTISAILHGIATRFYLASETHPRQWAVAAYHDTIIKLIPTIRTQNCS